jgi:hypothetical protein
MILPFNTAFDKHCKMFKDFLDAGKASFYFLVSKEGNNFNEKSIYFLCHCLFFDKRCPVRSLLQTIRTLNYNMPNRLPHGKKHCHWEMAKPGR